MRGVYILLFFFPAILARNAGNTRASPVCNKENQLMPKCSDSCEEILYCIKQADGSYDWEHFDTCDKGFICEKHGSKLCVEPKFATCTPLTRIACNETGLYPHPTDCSKNIFCNAENNENIIRVCEDGFIFSACTSKCDWKSNEDGCKSSESISCNSEEWGETKEVYSNKRMYYRCEKDAGEFIPSFFKCPAGQIYDGEGCKDHSGPGCGIE